MRNETEQQATLAAAEKTTVEFMQANINRLRGQLEEKRARSNSTAHWEGMIEDCAIILQHLETKPQPTRQDTSPRNFA
jgi:hypothetical protein